MRGSIVQRNGHYSIILDEGQDPVTGKRRQRWISVKGNKREADRQLAELLNQVNNGVFVKPGKQTVKEYLESWIRDISGPTKTCQGYQYNVGKYIVPAFGQLPLTGLKSEHIKKLLAEQKAQGHHRTAQCIYSTLNKSFNAAIKTGVLVRNPCDGVTKPKVERHEFKTLSEDDINRLLGVIKDSEYYPMFFTDLFTAMRRGELLAIRWSDIDLLAMTLGVNRTIQKLQGGGIVYRPPKTAKSRRSIALTPANCVVLREHKSKQEELRRSLGLPPLLDDDLVFCHYDGSPYLPQTVSHAWLKLVRRNGLGGIRLHDARHSHATILLEKGIHPKIVQERLGHATIATTLDIYSHVVPGLQAAAAVRFDEILQPKESKLDEELNNIIR